MLTRSVVDAVDGALAADAEVGSVQVVVLEPGGQGVGALDKEIRATISRAIDASPSLRNKKDLIEEFVDSLTVTADVTDEWQAYLDARRAAELEQIITEQRLRPEEAHAFMASAFRDGRLEVNGTAITRVLPPRSRFGGGDSHAATKQTVHREADGVLREVLRAGLRLSRAATGCAS